MLDLRRKTRLNRGEVPVPATSRSTSLESGEDCSSYTGQYDANDDDVVNVVDYSCDPRVERDPGQRGGLGVGPSDLLDPQDILIAFSDGDDDDSNGFTDDMVGWDFLDNDNDPFDDVQYGHGTGEARDSTARPTTEATSAPVRTAWRSTCASATPSSPTRTASRRPPSTPPTTAST